MMKIRTNHPRMRDLIGFQDVYLMLIGIPLLGFLVPLLFFGSTLEDGLVAYLPKWVEATVYSAAYWITVRWIFIYTRRRIPEPERIWRRIGFVLLLFFPSYILINVVFGLIGQCLPGMANYDGSTTFLELNVGSLSIILIVSALYESAYFYTRWIESLTEQERLRRRHTESQLEGLKNQVNPHFLFNSLNTLAYIIPEDPERAVRFVQELSRVYRYILEIRDYRLVPLQSELDFLDAYTFLLKERFGDKIHIEIDVSEDYRHHQIIPLSLQMLFENAIKHNEISASYPLHIRLEVQKDKLYVRNTLRRKKQLQPSTRVGLQNIQNRYAFFTQETVEVSETGEFFLVTLPLMNSKPTPKPKVPQE